MRQSVQRRESAMIPASKPSTSRVMTTTQQISKPMINHPYTKEDSSGSERGQQRIKRQLYMRESSIGARTGSFRDSKRLTVHQKRQTLQRYKYINPLARLEYEDKMTQVYTKYTKMSKASVIKKIKAKNRIAEFEQQDQEANQGFDELIQFKFGKDQEEKIYFDKEEIIEYQFCQYCDTAHNDHPEAHSVICEKKRKEQPELYSPFSEKYTEECLYRIKLVVEKIKSPEFEQLNQILLDLQKIVGPSKSTFSKGKSKIVKDIEELKQIYCNDIIFVKIIAKVSHLVKQL